MKRAPWTTVGLAMLVAAAGCAPAKQPERRPLVPATTTMVTAWQVPKNPFEDRALGDTEQAREIKWGFRIFTDTRTAAPQLAHASVSCANCHLNAGQRERALPIVGIAAVFPEHNKRSGRSYLLTDRIIDCFMRSENGTATPDALPTAATKEVRAVQAYIDWISTGYEHGKSPAWRGQNTIAPGKLIPVDRIDIRKGESLFVEKCTSCHGPDGQGVWIGDKKAGPLWGPDSWNDGAGAARVYTLAGIIRYAMPYLDPGSLTDEEAQEVAAFITSKPRPIYPFKAKDYTTSPLPPDAVYYRR